jgi:hypothetical protein
MSSTETSLASWRDTATTQAIRDFVAAATREGDRGYVPPPERLAVYGTRDLQALGDHRPGA